MATISHSSVCEAIIPFASGTSDAIVRHAFVRSTAGDDEQAATDAGRAPRALTQLITAGGNADFGVLMRGDQVDVRDPRPVSKFDRRTVVDIAASAFSTAVLTETNEVFVSGLNDEGQLVPEERDAEILLSPTLCESVATQRIVAVSCGEKHVGLINAAGVPLTFGSNETHALGHSDEREQPFRIPPRAPRGLGSARIVQIACGASHSLLLTHEGRVLSMGSGVRGALGHGTRDDVREPTAIAGLACMPARFVAAGDNYSAVLTATGAAYAFGYNKLGQLGLPTADWPHSATEPVRVPLPELAQHVSCGEAHTVWLSRSGRAWAAGRNDCGQLGIGFPSVSLPALEDAGSAGGGAGSSTSSGGTSAAPFVDVPVLVSALEGKRLREVACGRSHTLFLTADGQVYACGDSHEGATGVVIPEDIDGPTLAALGTATPAAIASAAASTTVAAGAGGSPASAADVAVAGAAAAPAEPASVTSADAPVLPPSPALAPSTSSSGGGLFPGLRKVGTFAAPATAKASAASAAFAGAEALASAEGLATSGTPAAAAGAASAAGGAASGLATPTASSQQSGWSAPERAYTAPPAAFAFSHPTAPGSARATGASGAGAGAGAGIGMPGYARTPGSMRLGFSAQWLRKSPSFAAGMAAAAAAAAGGGAFGTALAAATNGSSEAATSGDADSKPASAPASAAAAATAAAAAAASLVTAEEAEKLRAEAALTTGLAELDLTWARGGCLWAPTLIPGLSGIGVFRVAAGADHSVFLRVARGCVLSLPAGSLAPGAIASVDAVTLAGMAREASSSQNFAALKRVLREVFAAPGVLNASFLRPLGGVETGSGSGSGAAGPGAANGAVTGASGNLCSPASAPVDGVSAPQPLLLFQAVAPPALRPRRGSAASAASAASSSSSPSPKPPTASAARGTSAPTEGAAGLPVLVPSSLASGSDTGTAASDTSSAASVPGALSSLPPPAKRRAVGEDEFDEAPACSGVGAGASGAGAPHTRVVSGVHGGAAPATVIIAPAVTGPRVASSRLSQSSMVDVPGLEAAYAAVLGTFDPDVTTELARANLACVEALEAAAGRMAEPDALRAIMMTMLSPVNAKPSLTAGTVARLCATILALPQASRDRLIEWMGSDVPGALFGSRLVRMLQGHLSYHLRNITAGRTAGVVATAHIGGYDALPASAAAAAASAGRTSSSSVGSGRAPVSGGAGVGRESSAAGGAGVTLGAAAAAAGAAGSSDPAASLEPGATILLTTLDGRVIGSAPADMAGLLGPTLGAAGSIFGSAAQAGATPAGGAGAAGSSAAAGGAGRAASATGGTAGSRAGAVPSSAGSSGARSAAGSATKPSSSSLPAVPRLYTVRETHITHLYALELVVRVLRLLFNLNEKLGSEAAAGLTWAPASALADGLIGSPVSAATPSVETEGSASGGAGAAAAAASPPPSRAAAPSSSGSGSGSAGAAASAASSDWALSSVPSGMKVSPSTFYNVDLQELPDAILQMDYQRWARAGFKRCVASPIVLCGYPFLFDASTKRRILMFESAGTQAAEAQNAIARSFFHGGESPYLILNVRRSNVLSDSLNQLVAHPASDLKKPLRVIFDGEEGIDEGGPRKELFQMLIRECFEPKYGLFRYSERTREFWFAPQAVPGAGSEYFLVGCVLGLAIFNGIVLDVALPLTIYKKLLGQPIGLADLAEVNPDLAEGLHKLLAYEGGDDEDVFCLTWSVDYDNGFGEVVTADLVPGGRSKPVTAANKAEYVRKLVDWHLNVSCADQFRQFLRGFVTVMSGPALMLFRPEELQLLVSGTPHLDFRELEKVASYEGWPGGAAHPAVKAFWRAVHGMSHAEQTKFLTFFGGCPKAPVGGLGKLAFKLQRAGPDSDRLPTASVCFGILLLPEYASEERLKSKLLKAVEECRGFGLK